MEEIRDRKLKIVGERYDSFLEFYRVNEARPLNAIYQQVGDGAAEAIFEVADGVMFSPKDTREALLYGSSLFHERFEQARVSAAKLLRDKYEWLEEPRFDSDTHGQHVIVERYVKGHPESFSRRRPNTMKKRSVSILYDAMCSASTPLEQRIKSGCAVLAAMHALEQIGYETALSFVLAKYSGANVKGDPTLVLDITLKGYGQRVLPAKVEFPLASKSMLFHVGSWWAHRAPCTPIDYGEGEGYPLSYDKARLEAMRAYAQERRGVYISEDTIELQLDSDPVRVLEHVVEGIGEEERLIAHLRGNSRRPMGMQSSQGKLFSGWEPGGDGMQELPGAGQGEPKEQKAPDKQDTRGNGPSYGDEAAGAESVSSGSEAEGDSQRMQGEASSKQSADAPASASEDGPLDMSSKDSGSAKPEQGTAQSSDTGNGAGESQDPANNPSGQGGDLPSSESPDNTQAGEDGSSLGDDDGEEESADESEGSEMSEEESDNGMDYASIAKVDDDDEVQTDDPAMPQSAQDFVKMLRRRYIMFEQGEYLDMMISQKMALRKQKKAQEQANPPVVKAPSVEAPTLDKVQFGAPRNTPFSMTNIPQKKN